MFNQLLESSLSRKGKRRWRYFTATAVLWVATLTVVIVSGVVAYEAGLGDISEITHIGMGLRPQDHRDDSRRAERKQKATVKQVHQPKALVSHQESPTKIEAQTTPPLISNSADQGDEVGPSKPSFSGGGNTPGAEGNGGETQTGRTEPAEQNPQPDQTREEQPQAQLQQVRRSGGVLQGTATRRVNPVYPPLAKVARVMGAVVVEVVVDESGNVSAARPLSGHALLREAAVAAASQWKWKPTLLSGVPVQVVGTITFNFTQ